ncbi:A/G-specific adenine glycosylase, partial [mine drainage metagenome]
MAEFLLQQTRVDQARPFYHRFLARFPDLPSLARAREGSVLKAWEGAGYYARARHLRDLARTVVRVYGGTLPHRVEQLRELPGVGEYTARALAAIAFRRPVLAVDANVERVL